MTNSSDGGITNFGLWDNFEFSFKCKIINKNVGWIIRATDRVNYFMIQVSLDNIEKPTINPHFRINGEWLKEKRNLILKNPISINEWFQVVIKVYGNTINVFINNQHALHYFIPDPGRTITSRPIIMTKLDETNGSKEDIEKFVQQHNMIFSFPNGKVGFRCHGNEHAHFKNIKVIPLPRM
ncbi:MAG: family 16 glycoside hydrolase [bacterium]